MRCAGRIVRWEDNRGFGFIEPNGGGDAVFVHVSDFARDQRRPCTGDAVTYSVAAGRNGRSKAVDACLRDRSMIHPNRVSTTRGNGGTLLVIAVVGAMVLAVYADRHGIVADSKPSVKLLERPTQSFTCDGRVHCSQMTSCEEATYFLKHCPNTMMDGDADGIPCEQQWCE